MNELKSYTDNTESSQKEIKKEIVFVPEIYLTGTLYQQGSFVKGRFAWNFSKEEAQAWIDYQTQNFKKLKKLNPTGYCFETKIVEVKRNLKLAHS